MLTTLKRTGSFLLAVLLLTLAVPRDAMAQQKTLTVKGTVLDNDGVPVPGVTLYDKAQQSRGAVTSEKSP